MQCRYMAVPIWVFFFVLFFLFLLFLEGGGEGGSCLFKRLNVHANGN